MSDQDRLSVALTRPCNNAALMIALAREILDLTVQDKELYESDLIEPFIAIDAGTDHILLQDYHQYNEPSPRFGVAQTMLQPVTASSGKAAESYQIEMEDIFASYSSIFDSARRKLQEFLRER